MDVYVIPDAAARDNGKIKKPGQRTEIQHGYLKDRPYHGGMYLFFPWYWTTTSWAIINVAMIYMMGTMLAAYVTRAGTLWFSGFRGIGAAVQLLFHGAALHLSGRRQDLSFYLCGHACSVP